MRSFSLPPLQSPPSLPHHATSRSILCGLSGLNVTFLCLEYGKQFATNFARRYFAVNKAYEAFTLKTRGVAMTLPRPTLYVGDVYFLRPHEKVTHIHCTIPGEPNIRQWIMSCSSFMPNLRCVAMLGLFPPNQRQADVNPVFGHDETAESSGRAGNW